MKLILLILFLFSSFLNANPHKIDKKFLQSVIYDSQSHKKEDKAIALFNLAQFRLFGAVNKDNPKEKLIEVDKKEAFIYFSDSYELGYKRASVDLVNFYLFEEGEVTKNLKRAKKFLEESIKNNYYKNPDHLKNAKNQLKSVKEELAQIPQKRFTESNKKLAGANQKLQKTNPSDASQSFKEKNKDNSEKVSVSVKRPKPLTQENRIFKEIYSFEYKYKTIYSILYYDNNYYPQRLPNNPIPEKWAKINTAKKMIKMFENTGYLFKELITKFVFYELEGLIDSDYEINLTGHTSEKDLDKWVETFVSTNKEKLMIYRDISSVDSEPNDSQNKSSEASFLVKKKKFVKKFISIFKAIDLLSNVKHVWDVEKQAKKLNIENELSVIINLLNSPLDFILYTKKIGYYPFGKLSEEYIKTQIHLSGLTNRLLDLEFELIDLYQIEEFQKYFGRIMIREIYSFKFDLDRRKIQIAKNLKRYMRYSSELRSIIRRIRR